jgi:hypothetical protein
LAACHHPKRKLHQPMPQLGLACLFILFIGTIEKERKPGGSFVQIKE